MGYKASRLLWHQGSQIKPRFTDLGAAALPTSPADFEKLGADETEKWAKISEGGLIQRLPARLYIRYDRRSPTHANRALSEQPKSKVNEPFAMHQLMVTNRRFGSAAAVSVTSTDRPVFHRQRPYRCTAANWRLGQKPSSADPTRSWFKRRPPLK
jgi:hypothetical protein